eukprot:Pompholyxophrys_punicea_v1_NODE_499_length_1832_cov_7.614519.p1 type:complete len:111 gc:universal NODE_499_length_1832_cov_7.614519:469-137(-)
MIYCLYGDVAYPLNQYLLCNYRGAALTPAQIAFNTAMAPIREPVEWGFNKVLQQWGFLTHKRNLKIFLQPVGKYYIIATLLTNFHTIFYGSQTSMYFDVDPPSLATYLGD